MEDLNPETRDKVITEHAQFMMQVTEFENLSENFQKGIQKAENLKTPWFTTGYVLDYAKDEVIKNIEINNYLFDADGNLLPLTYHMRDGKIDHIRYRLGEKQLLVELN